MATIQQIEANRRNALKSTGPRTPEGKAAVRLNSLRHGLRARTLVLPGESRRDFQMLCDGLETEWQPQSMSEQFYLEQMAVSQWKLMRMEVGEADISREVSTARVRVLLLDRLWQAQSRLERSYARAQRELERLQNSRRQREQPAPAPQPAVSAPQPAQKTKVASTSAASIQPPAAAALPIDPDRLAPPDAAFLMASDDPVSIAIE